MSDRCCIDTTSLLPPGTGLLVGDSGSAMFLVHNENVQSPYCAARPFRVNAGAVHAYVRLPENRTKYLCELSAGDEVLAVDPKGNSHTVAVGRNKIERRPMMLVSAQNKKGKRVSLVLQNAETIRLTTPDGKPASVTRLQKGDMVLAFFGESTGRHFGEAIQETIREK
jgi:3-dehydroquinate synthase II